MTDNNYYSLNQYYQKIFLKLRFQYQIIHLYLLQMLHLQSLKIHLSHIFQRNLFHFLLFPKKAAMSTGRIIFFNLRNFGK